MKNIIALGIFLAACHVYGNDINNEFDNEFNQEVSMTVADDCQTKYDNSEEMISQEETDTQETPRMVTVKNADGAEVTVPVTTLTLEQTNEVFNSKEGVEFLATMNLTPEQAFESIVNLLEQVQNRTMEINGKVSPIEGIAFAIYDTNYFVEASEFMTLQ